MSRRFETKKEISTRSERVKCVDFHDTEPWFLAALYTGNINVHNYETNSVLKTIEVTENVPVRSAKFVCRKQWIVCGSDDNQIRVFNYDTLERVKQFEAHQDYIRCLAVHPSQPFVLSCSDDMMIKLWNWEKGWQNTMTFEGHSHYVMQITFNPKDPNTFASASLDRTVKVWGLGSSTANFTLEGHAKGVNCVDYFRGGDKPYLISGADDHTVKVWDYSSKRCIQTLEGHSHNVSSVLFHPDLPLIVTGAEDNSVKIFHATTYQLENTLHYGMERCWSIAAKKGSNRILIGFDDGSVVVKIGREEPPVSMDSNGKVIWARQADIQTANIKAASDIVDGELVVVKHRDLESCQIYPQKLAHSPNGRFVSVCGDGEYVIYTAMGWRNTTYGNGLDFVWAANSKEFSVRDSSGRISVYETKEKQRKEKTSYAPGYSAEALFGGHLLGIRGQGFVEFREWGDLKLVRVIEVHPSLVLWSESGTSVAVCCEGVFYVLGYRQQEVDAALEAGGDTPPDGIASAFEVLYEISDSVKTGCWVGECFIYTTSTSRLHYCVGGEVIVLHHLDTTMYMLGYLAKENRIYLMDKDFNIYSFSLLQALLEFQTQVTRGDVQVALDVLPLIPEDHHNKCARFLESKGLKEIALKVSKDPDHRFELAIQLGKLDTAYEIACSFETSLRWKQLADLALSLARMDLAMECMVKADDLGGLLLLLTAMADRDSLEKLGARAKQMGKNNIAFVCLFLLGSLGECVDLLVSANRLPEAAFFCSTYAPSRIPEVVALWKKELGSKNPKAAEALASPLEYANMFEGYMQSLEREKQINILLQRRLPAELFPAVAQHGLLAVLMSAQQEAPAQQQQQQDQLEEPVPHQVDVDALTGDLEGLNLPQIEEGAGADVDDVLRELDVIN